MKLPLSAVKIKQVPKHSLLNARPDTTFSHYKRTNKKSLSINVQANNTDQNTIMTKKNYHNILEGSSHKQTFRIKQSQVYKREIPNSTKLDQFMTNANSKLKDKNSSSNTNDLVITGVSKIEHPQTMRDYIRIQLSKQKGSLRKSLTLQKNSRKFQAIINKEDLIVHQTQDDNTVLMPKNQSKKFLAIPNPQTAEKVIKPGPMSRTLSQRKSRCTQTKRFHQKVKSSQSQQKSFLQKSPSWLTVSGNQSSSKRTNYKMNLINLIDSQSLDKKQIPFCKKFTSNSLQKFYDFCLKALQKQRGQFPINLDHIITPLQKNQITTNKIIFGDQKHQPKRHFHCYNQPKNQIQLSPIANEKLEKASYSPSPNITIKSIRAHQNQNSKPILSNVRYARQKEVQKIQKNTISKIKVNHQDFALDGWVVQADQL